MMIKYVFVLGLIEGTRISSLLQLHRLSCGRGLVGGEHDFVRACGFGKAGERHFFAGGQRGEKRLELRGVGVIDQKP